MQDQAEPQADTQTDALQRLLDEHGQDEARRIVGEMGRPSAVQELERVIARSAAAEMLQEGMPQPAIRDRLVAALGLNWRTAYRVIDAARQRLGIADKPPAEASPEAEPHQHQQDQPATSQPIATTAATTTTRTDHMTAQTHELESQLAAARAELGALELDAAQKRVQAAEKVRADLLARDGQSAPVFAPGALTPEAQAHAAALVQASRAAKDARQDLRAREGRAGKLRAEIQRLATLVDSADAVERARAAVEAARGPVTVAEQKLANAEGVVAKIADLIAQAERDIESEQSNAAAQVLQAVKAGAAAVAAPSGGRDRLATLQIARDSAALEVTAARAALVGARQRLTAAETGLLVAEAAAADLEHELLHAQYVQALAKRIAAHVRAHRTQPVPPQTEAKAHALAQAMLQAEAA